MLFYIFNHKFFIEAFIEDCFIEAFVEDKRKLLFFLLRKELFVIPLQRLNVTVSEIVAVTLEHYSPRLPLIGSHQTYQFSLTTIYTFWQKLIFMQRFQCLFRVYVASLCVFQYNFCKGFYKSHGRAKIVVLYFLMYMMEKLKCAPNRSK